MAHCLRQEWRAKGHGKLEEIPDQQTFFVEGKQNDRLICHFYRPSTWRCELLDKHLIKIASQQMETRFIKVGLSLCCAATPMCFVLNGGIVVSAMCSRVSRLMPRSRRT